MSRRWIMYLWIAAVFIGLVLHAFALYYGGLNQDEGWYLYAARLVSQGKLPYLDFASTQGPVMPFVYSVAGVLVDHLGVAGGRLFTILLGFAASLLAARLAARLAPVARNREAALLTFCLVGLNIYQVYFFTIVKTYALTAFLLTAGFLFLCSDRGIWRYAGSLIAGILLGLAAGTRASAGVILPVVLAVLVMSGWKAKGTLEGREFFGRSLWFAIGGAVTLATVFVPFVLKAPEALRFALLEYHAGRAVGGPIQALAYKAGFLARLLQAYFVPAGLMAIFAVVTLFRDPPRQTPGSASRNRLGGILLPALWSSVLAVTLVHFCTPFPYDDYQAPFFPLLAVALAVTIIQRLPDEPEEKKTEGLVSRSFPDARAVVVSIFLLCLISVAASPLPQGWMTGPRDRVWWPVRTQSPLIQLRNTARTLIRELATPGNLLLTQDLYLAVESGLTVPEGLELGPFSYFPEWSREKATACHVVNREMLMQILETTPASVAALSEWSFAIQAPQITRLPAAEQDRLWATLGVRYGLFREIPDFGHADTTLKVYLRVK